jgi:hypothetical protein
MIHSRQFGIASFRTSARALSLGIEPFVHDWHLSVSRSQGPLARNVADVSHIGQVPVYSR